MRKKRKKSRKSENREIEMNNIAERWKKRKKKGKVCGYIYI